MIALITYLKLKLNITFQVFVILEYPLCETVSFLQNIIEIIQESGKCDERCRAPFKQKNSKS